MVVIYLIGTAGSGKSTLASVLQSKDVKIINLDPNCVTLPYKSSFDIRDVISGEQIQKKMNLGPNAAILEAMKRLKVYESKLLQIINNLAKENQFVIVDTPGQIEVFLFYKDAPEIITKSKRAIAFFLMDARLCLNACNFVMLRLLDIIVSLKIPTIPVITKSDLLTQIEMGIIRRSLLDNKYLQKRIKLSVKGEIVSYALNIVKAAWDNLQFEPLFVSAISVMGIDDLLDRACEFFCSCGDLS